MSVVAQRFNGSESAQNALDALTHELQIRHSGAISALLFYGSCLRTGDLYDGLVDLYVIVKDYRSAYPSRFTSLANWLLPPNVYYCETDASAGRVRCKYAVLSLADLEDGCSNRWFQSYVWGRFCQPVAIAWRDSERTESRIRAAFLEAACTFINRTLPLVEPRGTLRSLWETGLAASYLTELRAEGGKRPGLIVDQGASFYFNITREVAERLDPPLDIDDGAEPGYRMRAAPSSATRARRLWKLRQLQGKTLSIARLLKALFTFDGGLDYIAWKLERHSGIPVHIPDKVRRWPLIFIWGLMWDLYRKGVFR